MPPQMICGRRYLSDQVLVQVLVQALKHDWRPVSLVIRSVRMGAVLAAKRLDMYPESPSTP